ncbi:MAG: hypothetical protein A2408_03750 [Candidatus Yonathbacteria bacterium RIFOXYC1_FULL_52_10]|uniref:Thioredoxin domain-containing protein n=1 Tax=Candidatus Yonathbacteria bacterium RIFOXYD1_FULL_52_36 TaxID=1802730 RepID=A0A1G2SN91_9BACT|nr:MAG: hypothetical protein A2408_03750 [Candidatus Yonathbacteria bacterium RIFOXYC1_FULL_52_10]OHA86424.1 MAG: hypothetical protein A2591_03175 [Candidatus Yonathbacteria bacterium RIFOXYD1_FULL_52_36]
MDGEQQRPEAPKNSLAVPGAIVIAGLLVAGAVFITNGGAVLGSAGKVAANAGGAEKAVALEITATDHVRGNPNAPVVVVEYSDPECPFCKNFHPTMQRIMSEYGAQGKVAWVYRSFPLDQIHSKAREEIEAIECAAEVGGNVKYWEYLDRVFEITPGNNGLDLALLPTIAQDLGLDVAEFEACRAEDKFADRIQAEYESGLAAGVRGTPHSIIIGKDGKQYVINGAQPYETVKQMIETALK